MRTIRIATTTGPATVALDRERGFLAVTRTFAGPGFALTHSRLGYAVCSRLPRDVARRALALLGELMVWDAIEPDCRAEDLPTDVRDALRALSAFQYSSTRGELRDLFVVPCARGKRAKAHGAPQSVVSQ